MEGNRGREWEGKRKGRRKLGNERGKYLIQRKSWISWDRKIGIEGYVLDFFLCFPIVFLEIDHNFPICSKSTIQNRKLSHACNPAIAFKRVSHSTQLHNVAREEEIKSGQDVAEDFKHLIRIFEPCKSGINNSSSAFH